MSSGSDSGSESLVSTVSIVGDVPDKSKYSLSLHNSKYSLFIIFTGISYPSLLMG